MRRGRKFRLGDCEDEDERKTKTKTKTKRWTKREASGREKFLCTHKCDMNKLNIIM